jgi:dihydrofolate reductase
MYASVSVDGFIADEDDKPGPLFDWLLSGDVPLDDSGVPKVSQASYDYVRTYWDEIAVTIAGRHVFDITDGWDGKPPSGVDHVVVVTHRPPPEGWDPAAPFHFVDGIEAAVAKAQELAGDRVVEVAAGDVGGQVLAAGLVDEVRMDVVPVVFGTGKRFFGSVASSGRSMRSTCWRTPTWCCGAIGCSTCAIPCAAQPERLPVGRGRSERLPVGLSGCCSA